ncbi:unnamed protein product [Laminaria digitata]
MYVRVYLRHRFGSTSLGWRFLVPLPCYRILIPGIDYSFIISDHRSNSHVKRPASDEISWAFFLFRFPIVDDSIHHVRSPVEFICEGDRRDEHEITLYWWGVRHQSFRWVLKARG